MDRYEAVVTATLALRAEAEIRFNAAEEYGEREKWGDLVTALDSVAPGVLSYIPEERLNEVADQADTIAIRRVAHPLSSDSASATLRGGRTSPVSQGSSALSR